MQCTTCKREMVQLFLTQACDHCDYGVPQEKLHRGFIVLLPVALRGQQPSCDEYVFRTRMDAERWKVASGRDEKCEIVEVFSLEPFTWHLSRGTLRDVVLADHMFEIFPDHRFESKPYRAFMIEEPITQQA